MTALLLGLVFSCGNRQHIPNEQRLKKKNDKELEAALFDQDSIPFDFLSVRIGVDFKSKTQNRSFSCFVKLKVDSAFGGSIKAAGIVVATYLVSKDSLIFVSKFQDCYVAESFDAISSLLGATVEFDFVQDLMLGLPIGLEEGTKYKQINSKDHYILSSHKKRDFKKLENERLDLEEDLMLIQYHLNAETLALFRTDIEIPSDTTSISVNYLERKLEEGVSVPESTRIIVVNPNDSIFIQFNYAPVKLNDPKEISIKIPDGYVACP